MDKELENPEESDWLFCNIFFIILYIYLYIYNILSIQKLETTAKKTEY